MSPIDRIAVEYARRGVDFAAALERNYAGGFVFSTPEYFIMGRPHPERADTWFVEGMAGDCGRAWDILPWPMGWIAFHRFDSDLHLYRMEDIRRLSASTDETTT